MEKAFDVVCCPVHIHYYKNTHFHICDKIYNYLLTSYYKYHKFFFDLLVLLTDEPSVIFSFPSCFWLGICVQGVPPHHIDNSIGIYLLYLIYIRYRAGETRRGQVGHGPPTFLQSKKKKF